VIVIITVNSNSLHQCLARSYRKYSTHSNEAGIHVSPIEKSHSAPNQIECMVRICII